MFDSEFAPRSSPSPDPVVGLEQASSPGAPGMASGVIARIERGICVVQTSLGAPGHAPRGAPTKTVRARQAASCLVEPREGDRVLFATVEDGGAFVLAILERDGASGTVLSVAGDLSLRVPSGALEVVTKEGVDVVSTGDVSVTSAGVAIQAGEGRIGVDRLTVLGEQLVAEIPAIRVVAQAVDSVFERLSQRVKRAYRTVEELDRLRAARIDYRAEKTMQLSAEDALVTATDVVKIDAEHVHLG